MSNCFNIPPLVIVDTFNTWFQRTNTIISTINDIEIAGISVYDHPSYNYFGQKIEQVNNSCYLTSEIITGPFINFIDGDSSTYGAGTSADPRKITLTFPNTSAFLADRQLTGNDELIINDGSVAGGIPVKRIKANNLVPSVIDVGYLRIQNRNQTSQGATFSFYSESSALNNVWSGISASSFSSERVGGFIPATGPISIGNNVFKPIIPVTDETTGLIPDSFVRLPLSFKLNDVTIQGFESPADVKFFDLSAGPGITMSESTGTDPTSGLVNSVSYTIEALIPDDGNSGPYGTNLFNINGYNALSSSLSADSRSLLSANSGISGGKGIKTNLINRDVSLPVTYIIPGDPNNVITYSGMTAVDIFTIEENPEDSNYVRKIGDIMTGTLTGTSTNFVFENGEVVNGFTSDNIYNTTLFSGKNLETENGYATFKIAAGSTFSVLDSENTSVLEITPTTDILSLNNGNHEFTTGNVSLSGVLQLDYTEVQSGKTLFVNGESKLEGNVEIYEGLVVDGGITGVNGDVYFEDSLSVSGGMSASTLFISSSTTLDTFTANTGNVGSLTGEKISIDNTTDTRATLEVALGKDDYLDDSWVLLAGSITNDSDVLDNTFGIASENNATHKSSVVSKGNMWVGYPNYRDAELRVHGTINVTGNSPQVNVNGEISAQSVTAGTVYSTKFRGMDFIPIGTILPYAGGYDNDLLLQESELDAGTYVWLACDGSTFLTIKYPELFEVIGHKYGGSSGIFSIPDFRGRVILGANPTNFESTVLRNVNLSPRERGDIGGSEDKFIEIINLPPHSHIFQKPNIIGNGERDNNRQFGDVLLDEFTSTALYDENGDLVLTGDGSNQNKFETMNPFGVASFIIKARPF